MSSLNDDPIIHALAGAAGGVASCLITYPLSSISTRLQVDKNKESTSTTSAILKIVKEDGWKGLYNGLSSALFGVAATQGVYYYWYEKIRAIFEGTPKKRLSVVSSLLVAAIAGAITVMLTNPIWVINVRMTLQSKNQKSDESQKEQPKGMLATLNDLVKKEGVLGLWSGVVPALILVSNPAIQYMLYEKIKQIVERKQKLTPFLVFLMGAFAKAIASTVTYPYIVVKSRLQMKQDDSQTDRYRNTNDVLLKIWKHEGPLGFFKGIQSKITQSVATAALLFMFKEEFVSVARYLVNMLRASPKQLKN